MSIWKKAMDYLGLNPDDVYEDYEPSAEMERPTRVARPEPGRVDYTDDASRPTVRPMREPDSGAVRRIGGEESGAALRPVGVRTTSGVKPLPQPGEPVTVKPRRFDQAQEVADRLREGQPVIMNLEGVDREVSRRLVDFASGVCYGVGGTMEKVAVGVFLLKPPARSQDGYQR